MNKKLMVVAVAGALAAPALAFAQANVQIYGRVNAGLDNYQAGGATAAGTVPGTALDTGLNQSGRNRVYDFTSRIGFKGEENLGGGLKAVFDIQSGFNADNGVSGAVVSPGQAGATNTSSGTIGSRTAHVGLQGSWGLLTFGRSNVWWGNGRNDQTGANYISGNTVGHFSGTFGRGMSVGITRQSNTMQYTTPTWSGFNGVVSYSPSNQEAAVPGANADGRLWGLTINGTVGSIHGGYDYVNNRGNNPAAGSATNVTGNKFRIGWAYQPGAQVSMLWIRTKHENDATVAGIDATATSLSQTAWGISWEHVFGNIQALAQYAKATNVSGCAAAVVCGNTNDTQYMIGARYLFSKRTAAYLTYGQTNNDSSYNQDYLGGSYTSGTAGLGADPRVWAIGVLHNF